MSLATRVVASPPSSLTERTPLEQVGRTLGRLARMRERQWEESLARFDLKAAHARVLCAVQRSPGVPIRQLARLVEADVMGTKRCVDDLVARGLVTTIQPTSDRRCRLASVTTAGRALVRRLEALTAQREGRLRADLGDQDYETLARVLAHLEALGGDVGAREILRNERGTGR